MELTYAAQKYISSKIV